MTRTSAQKQTIADAAAAYSTRKLRTASSVSWSAGDLSNWRLGFYDNSSVVNLTGYVAEMYAFASVLSTLERTTLESNIKSYWGTP